MKPNYKKVIIKIKIYFKISFKAYLMKKNRAFKCYFSMQIASYISFHS